MTGTVLVMILFISVVTLVFTVKIWRYAARESINSPVITIPKGKNMEEEKKQELDINELIQQVSNQIEVNAEESGESENVQIDPETIKKVMQGLKL